MKNNSAQNIVILGLLTSLTIILTYVIQIPVSATGGYINLGDGMIFLAAILFGWRYGMISGGIGAALADIIAGFGQWALPTLIIKGLMGIIVGKLARDNKKVLNFRNIVAMLVGTIWMTFGYYLTGAVLLQNFISPLTEVPFNILQGIIGMIIFFPIAIILKKSKIPQKYV